MRPLPAAVARSNGQIWAVVRRAAARASAAGRPASGVSGPPHGIARSAQSVLACSPWLSSPAGTASKACTWAISRSSAAGCPVAAACSMAGTPGKDGAPTLISTRVSNSAGPSWYRRTTVARSAAGSEAQFWAAHAARSTVAVSRMLASCSGSTFQLGTTESRTSRLTWAGCASANHSATYEPYDTPSRVSRVTRSAFFSASMSATVSAVAKYLRLGPTVAAHERTAAGVGTARSDAPISRCSAGQFSAPSPVPRWSNITSLYPRSAGPRRPASRGANGTLGWPGPPVRRTRTPRGAVAISDTATRSDSRPGAGPNGSSRTLSVPQLNPGIPGHGRTALSPVRLSAEPGPAGPVAGPPAAAGGREVALVCTPAGAGPPEQPASAPARTAVAMTVRPAVFRRLGAQARLPIPRASGPGVSFGSRRRLNRALRRRSSAGQRAQTLAHLTGGQVQVPAAGAAPRRLDAEPVTEGTRQDVQVYVEHLLEGGLPVGQEQVHAVTRQAGAAERPRQPVRGREHARAQVLVERL